MNLYTKQSKFKKIIWWGVLVCLFLILVSLILMWRFVKIESAKSEVIGVTFSQVQAERFGSNWHDNYLALMDDLGFKNIRLVAYWDRIETEKDKYDFSELDWMIDQAKIRGATVTLTIGQRVLRFPECFYPAWLNKYSSKEVRSRINKYITKLASRYKNESTIEAWQLENEFLLTAFGQCPRVNLGSRNLNSELKTLKTTDETHQIVITASDEFGLPVFGPTGNIFGFSMYKRVWNQITKNGYFTYRQPGWFNWWRAAWISFVHRTDIRIHELQAEPWGPQGNEILSTQEAYQSMNPSYLKQNIDYARSTKIKRFDLWGAEWWWFMKQSRGDHSMWEAVRNELNTN